MGQKPAEGSGGYPYFTVSISGMSDPRPSEPRRRLVDKALFHLGEKHAEVAPRLGLQEVRKLLADIIFDDRQPNGNVVIVDLSVPAELLALEWRDLYGAAYGLLMGSNDDGLKKFYEPIKMTLGEFTAQLVAFTAMIEVFKQNHFDSERAIRLVPKLSDWQSFVHEILMAIELTIPGSEFPLGYEFRPDGWDIHNVTRVRFAVERGLGSISVGLVAPRSSDDAIRSPILSINELDELKFVDPGGATRSIDVDWATDVYNQIYDELGPPPTTTPVGGSWPSPILPGSLR